MAEYTWKQWEQTQDNDNVINQANCERWQAGIELAGGSWSGSFEDGKDSITIDEFNALESQIQSKVSSYTPKNYDPDSTVQIVPGPDGWNKVEDGILKAVCEPDGVNRNLLGNSSANLGDTSGWTMSSVSGIMSIEVSDGYNGQNAFHITVQGKTTTSRYFFNSQIVGNIFVANTAGMKAGDPISFSIWVYVGDDIPITSVGSRTEVFLRQYNADNSSYTDRVLGVLVNASGQLQINYNEWTKLELSTTLPYDQTGQNSQFYVSFAGDIDILLSCIKAEKGGEITEWSPAPEDYGYLSATTLSASATPQSVEDSDEVAAPEAEEIE